MMRSMCLAVLLVAGGLLGAPAACGSIEVRSVTGQASGVAARAIDRRGEEQTFLTFPEWFLVFSPTEYAVLVRTRTPDEFCFWGHIGQFWRSYAAVAAETRQRHDPNNWGYHLMIVVIGVSTTVEYAMRSAYETLIGRFTAWTAPDRTEEDEYAAQAAQEYVDLIRDQPWYEFDFLARLKGLWTHTSLFGPHMLRKWERRYALTTEYGVKAVYGWLIGKASKQTYDAPLPYTVVLVDHWPACPASPAGVSVLAVVDGGGSLLSVPRYHRFTAASLALAHCGIRFQEIAGNRTDILLSVLGPTGSTTPPGTRALFRQPLLTQSGRERAVYVVPVGALGGVLREVDGRGCALEHVFDY
jgi:hypothetical protein